MNLDCVLATGPELAAARDGSLEGSRGAIGGIAMMVDFKSNTLPKCSFLLRKWIRRIKIAIYGSADPLGLNIDTRYTILGPHSVQNGAVSGSS